MGCADRRLGRTRLASRARSRQPPGMILVTGATGNVGSELVRILAEAGEPVRGLVRDESRRARLPAGVDGVVGDLNAPGSLGPALEGVTGVHLLAGYAGLPDALER